MKSLISTILAGVLLMLGAGYLGSLEFAQGQHSTRGMTRLEIEQKRQEWFYHQRAYPGKRVPADARLRALKQLDRMLAEQKAHPSPGRERATWTQIGPEPAEYWSQGGSSGRATAVVVDPGNSNTVYLGTAGGGVWKTTDGGETWTPLTDTQPSLAIGSLALDPSNPDIVYAGTGEENFSVDSYYGAGILKSTDAGATWESLPGPNPSDRGPIGSIAVHPANGSIVLLAATTGVFRSADGGATWTMVVPATGTAVLFNPSNGNIAWAAAGAPFGDAANGIYQSIDAGQTWTKMVGAGTGTLGSNPLGRIGLALDSSNPQTLYAAIANPIGSPLGDTLGVFRTTDAGQTWAQLGTPPSCCTWYENPIAVDPANPNVLFTGAFDVSRSTDGGATWTDISHAGPNGIDPHPDQHDFAFSADGSTLYLANDGGAFSTSDIEATPFPNWNNLNSTLATVTFYPGLSISPVNPSLAFGGTQDNGTLRFTGNLPWDWVQCGDGNYTAIDSASPANVYINCAGLAIYKSTSNGDPGTFFPAITGIDASDGAGWVAPLVLDPSMQRTLYFGGNHFVYRSIDGAASWQAISPSFMGGLTTLAVAPSDSNTVYAGTGDGHVHVTIDATDGPGAVWTDTTSLPDRTVTRVAVDPENPMLAYAALSGFSGQMNPSEHVFETTDGGATWTDISANLPDVPVNAIVVDTHSTSTLYVGTDVGVFYTRNRGSRWLALVDGLPRVVVQDLKLDPASRTLRAATHGRSAWDIRLRK